MRRPGEHWELRRDFVIRRPGEQSVLSWGRSPEGAGEFKLQNRVWHVVRHRAPRSTLCSAGVLTVVCTAGNPLPARLGQLYPLDTVPPGSCYTANPMHDFNP